MNQRIVVGFLVASGLGIGLFAAAERVMRGAGKTVTKAPPPPQAVDEPEKPVEIVTVTPKPKPPAPRPAAAPARAGQAPAATVATAPQPAPRGDVQRWEEPRPAPLATVARPVNASGVKVDRLAVCLAVKDRNPANETATVPADVGKVFAWMRVAGAAGKKVRTVWTVNGKAYPGTWLSIGSNSFRTWATKRVDASMKGAARVEVQDEKGNVLASRDFRIVTR